MTDFEQQCAALISASTALKAGAEADRQLADRLMAQEEECVAALEQLFPGEQNMTLPEACRLAAQEIEQYRAGLVVEETESPIQPERNGESVAKARYRRLREALTTIRQLTSVPVGDTAKTCLATLGKLLPHRPDSAQQACRKIVAEVLRWREMGRYAERLSKVASPANEQQARMLGQGVRAMAEQAAMILRPPNPKRLRYWSRARKTPSTPDGTARELARSNRIPNPTPCTDGTASVPDRTPDTASTFASGSATPAAELPATTISGAGESVIVNGVPVEERAAIAENGRV